MAPVMGSTLKAVLGFTLLWFVFVWCALTANVEAVHRVTALKARPSGTRIVKLQKRGKITPTLPSSLISQSEEEMSSCADFIISAEQRYGIPEDLLQAISKVESGRSDGAGHVVAHPWTLNVEGEGHFYPTKQAALNAVKQFQRMGKKSIDVGCMQVNLLHHPDAFPSLAVALDPRHNVEYAARFLKSLRESRANWHQAVAHYHSAKPEHHGPYRERVMAQWNKEKKGGNRVDSPTHLLAKAEKKHIHKVAARGSHPKRVGRVVRTPR